MILSLSNQRWMFILIVLLKMSLCVCIFLRISPRFLWYTHTHTRVFIQLESWCTDSSNEWQLRFKTLFLSLGLTQAHMRPQTNWALNLAQLWFPGVCWSSRCGKTSCHKTKGGEENLTDCSVQQQTHPKQLYFPHIWATLLVMSQIYFRVRL